MRHGWMDNQHYDLILLLLFQALEINLAMNIIFSRHKNQNINFAWIERNLRDSDLYWYL